MNKLWCFLLLTGILICFCTGNINELGNIILDSSSKAYEIFIQTAILILFWGGLFQIAIDSGMVKRFSKLIKKPLKFLYPELDLESIAYELICSNIIANILGLGAAATPIGLQAFKELQKLSKDKNVPTRSMLTFIIINCSSLTLVPTTIISFRKLYGGSTNLIIVMWMNISTTISTCIAVILHRIFYKHSKL